MFNEIWPLMSVVLGIVILLVLIIGFKIKYIYFINYHIDDYSVNARYTID
ncbi:hypothetical protein ACV56Z_12905 [Staphylococcus aureus]